MDTIRYACRSIVSMDDLVPILDHEAATQRARQFAATRLLEMIESLRPYVDQVLGDPASVHDLEPGRIQAHTALIKLQATLIKELGDLYQVRMPPKIKTEDVLPAAKVQEMLEQQRLELEQAAVLAREALAAELRAEFEARQQLSLEAARSRVVEGLEELLLRS